jgi:hypothetical protein
VAVALDTSDNILVAVQFQSPSADFGGIILSAAGSSQDMALVKLSTAGATLWAQRWGSTDVEFPVAIAVDSAKNVLVTGKFFGTTDLGGGAKTSVGGADLFVAKYSGVDGSHIWDRTMGGVNSDSVYGIAADPNTGNVVITGSYIGAIDFGGGARNSGSGGGVTMFMAGYDPSGNYLWANVSGGDLPGNPDTGMAVRIDASGNLALAGVFNSWMDFNNDGLNDAPGGGFFVASFRLTGNSAPVFRWAKRSTTSSGEGSAVAFDSQGHLLVCGRWQGILTLDGNSATSPAATTCPFFAQYYK